MGKTSIFGRQSSSRKSTNEQKDVREKSRRESSEKRKIRESKTSGLHSDDKLSGRKLSERLTPAKQLSENRNSLKRRKKHETVRTMVQSLPKDKEGRPGDAPQSESEAESIYESRKLLIRQIQGQIAKQVHEGRDSVSEYDSWSDLEDNFALAYEPIPLNIKMETWRKMTKREILRKVNSKKIRKDFEYLSHSEILQHIEKMQNNARYLSSKFGINHLMPHLDQVQAEVHNHPEPDDTEVEQSDGEISHASFVSGKEIYLSRAEILNKIHKGKSDRHQASASPPSNKSSRKAGNKTGANLTAGKLSPNRNGRTGHDSWSSRASSILKDPEAIYVSRVELLKKITVLEDPKADKTNLPREKGRNSVTPKPSKTEKKPRETREVRDERETRESRETKVARESRETRETRETKVPRETRERRQHDSWSSRASSILAAIEAEEATLQDEEPVYISRVELLKHLQMKSLEALSAASDKSGESDSDASTVKNSASSQVGQQRRWKSQALQFEADMLAAIRDKQTEHERREKARDVAGTETDGNNNVGGEVEPDWDSCSCLTCHTCHFSDCSCSDISLSSQASKSSHSSDGSVETIIDAQRVVKHSDIYIVNGSDVSKASSKASSKLTKKSANYDPLPLNGIEKIKQRKLTEEEIEIERRQEKEENIRRSSVNERPVREKSSRGKSREVKGSVKSQGSWTNEEFAKLYEPISAEDVKRQKQMKDLRKHLQAWTPELGPQLGKTLEHINTARRREVMRKLKNVVAKNLDLDNLSEEELGKHLDIALNNLNLGAMYVPMEKNPSNSKAVSRENTDYDTFGSIDSLIFEPKLPTHEDIEEAQEEITQSFEYLENEDDGQGEMELSQGQQINKMNILEKVSQFEKSPTKVERRSPKYEKNAIAVGKTSFAERVKLFQSLGDKKSQRSAVTPQHHQHHHHHHQHQQEQQHAGRETEVVWPAASRGRDSPLHDSAGQKRETSLLSQTTWKEQALNKKVERSGRDSATSQSTTSSGSTVIYNVAEPEEELELKKSSYQRRGSFVGPEEDRVAGQVEEVCSTCGAGGECSRSIMSEWSCSCYEDCSCLTDCSECGADTLTRHVDSASKDKEESLYDVRDNQIPVVGNLRRVKREMSKPTMNIEKSVEKKGFIAEDEEEFAQQAPSMEHGTKMPLKIKQKLERTDSFHQRQKRNQFRSFSPDAKVEEEHDQKHSHENNKKQGLLVEVENGLPLIYKTDPHAGNSECLESPKSKSSEMGDSGISSDPSSISPKSSSSGCSGDQEKAAEPEVDKSGELISKLVPPGAKKRDTMIRELKGKLKERFPSNTIEDKSRRQTQARTGNTIRTAEVGPKLTKIFDALLSESREKSPSPRLLRSEYRNGSFSHDDNLETVGEVATSDTECDSSVYDPSLPPGLDGPLVTPVRSPPPGPPPTSQSKRGSVTSGSYQVTPEADQPRLSPAGRREALYGPGGVFGPRGPFSTPEISRYPEVPAPKRISFADLVDGRSEEDRSDKSQYVTVNTVISGQRTSPTRLESYRVSPVAREKDQKEAGSGVAWQQEKQKRMINWINKSQVALGGRVLVGGGSKNEK